MTVPGVVLVGKETALSPESARLTGQIRQVIAAEGPIPFERFMALALYTPDIGYYTGSRNKIGQEGDFFTSLDLHPAFGQLVAAQIIEMSEALPDGPYTVVEMGAGKGLLAFDILRTIQAARPELFARLRYRIVDVSPHLIGRQKEQLDRFDCVDWVADLDALEPLNGLFLSNELVDSFPHHQVVMTEQGLKEVYVDVLEDGFRELLKPLSTPRLSAYLKGVGATLKAPYRTEVNLAAINWMKQVAKTLIRGHVLTIDYGYPAALYYRPERRTGTFLCYHQHQLSENPYMRIGLQDMTAHVDFSGLARAGKKAGLSVMGFTDQSHFLVGLGITHIMERVLQRDGGDPANSDEFKTLRKLMDPDAMGKTFKVLVQGKGVPHSQPLSGLRVAAYSVQNLDDRPDPSSP